MTMTWGLHNQDFVIDPDGKLLQVYGAEEVKQRILVTLQHYYQEYFLNVPAGVPWYELILGSKDIPVIDALLRDAILRVPGVVSIYYFNLSINGRELSISGKVEVSGQQSPQIVDIIFSTIGMV